jgi:uroporphyrinogen-III synthase
MPRVLVTRPLAEAGPWVQQLRERGFDAVALPLIGIGPAPDPTPLLQAWRELASCRAVMFVSTNAVREFFARRPAGAAWPAQTRAWSPGAGTRRALAAQGVPDDQLDSPAEDSPRFDSEALWQRVAVHVRPGDCVLIVRGGEAGDSEGSGRDWLPDQLRRAGAQVRTVMAYVRAVPQFSATERDEAIAGASSGVWLFSSSQAVANLKTLLPGQSWAQARAIATHPRIAQAARDAGFGVVCESRPALADVSATLKSFG